VARNTDLSERVAELVNVALHYRADGVPADLQLFEGLLSQLLADIDAGYCAPVQPGGGPANVADLVRELVTLLTTEMIWGSAHTEHDVLAPASGAIETPPGGVISALLRRPVAEPAADQDLNR
jgi:hypothetical protein